jgi:hypothetical protein
MSSIEAPQDSIPILVHGRNWDPKDEYAKDAERTDYITITTFKPLEPLEHEALEKADVEILEAVDWNTFLCHYKPTQLEAVRKLPFVRQADVYRNKFKIPRAMQRIFDPEIIFN